MREQNEGEVCEVEIVICELQKVSPMSRSFKAMRVSMANGESWWDKVGGKVNKAIFILSRGRNDADALKRVDILLVGTADDVVL